MVTLRITGNPAIDRGVWMCFSQNFGISNPPVLRSRLILRVKMGVATSSEHLAVDCGTILFFFMSLIDLIDTLGF